MAEARVQLCEDNFDGVARPSPWALGLGVAIEVTAAGKLIDVVRIL